MLTGRERWKNQRHGTSSMFFWFHRKSLDFQPNNMVDLEVACMIFLLKVFVRCFGQETYLFFSPGGVTHIKKQKTASQSRQLIWCLLSLEKVGVQQKKRTKRQLGCALKVVENRLKRLITENMGVQSGITPNWQKSTAHLKNMFLKLWIISRNHHL